MNAFEVFKDEMYEKQNVKGNEIIVKSTQKYQTLNASEFDPGLQSQILL